MNCILKVIGTTVLVSVVSGCATRSDVPQNAPSQSQLRSWIVEQKGRIFIDPDSVRDADIGQPYLNFLGNPAVCFGANARNRLGGYTGYRHQIVSFTPDGRFILATEPTIYDMSVCSSGQMTRFPEIQADYVAPKSSAVNGDDHRGSRATRTPRSM